MFAVPCNGSEGSIQVRIDSTGIERAHFEVSGNSSSTDHSMLRSVKDFWRKFMRKVINC